MNNEKIPGTSRERTIPQDHEPEQTYALREIDALAVNYAVPWPSSGIPDGYAIVDETAPPSLGQPGKLYGAVYALAVNGKGEAIPKRIGGPIWVTSLTHSNTGKDWGMQIAFVDLNGGVKSHTCSRRLIHDRSGELIALLVSSGYEIVPGHEGQLLKFLGAWKPDARTICVSNLGWLDQSFGFMLPDGAIGTENIVFQPEKNVALNFGSDGSFVEWQEKVAGPASHHLLSRFALFCAFAAPLLKFSGLNSFGFQLFGNTSRGKTTAAQIAATVWGRGSDPAVDPNGSFIRRWNMTANAQEALAAASNDGLLVLDELGANTVKDASALIYNIFGGRGKEAMNADRSMRSARTWRMLLLSTGEIPVSQRLEEAGQSMRGGLAARFLDLRFRSTMTKREVEAIKQACGQQYGLVGPMFVRGLIEKFKDASRLQDCLRLSIDNWANALIAKRKLLPEQERAAKNFALIAVAGVWAINSKILPVTCGVLTDVKNIFDAWLSSDFALSDSMKGVLALRDFLFKHQESRFKPYPDNAEPSRIRLNLAGYYSAENSTFFLTKAGMKEATAGYDIEAVCKELVNLRLLGCYDGRYQKRISVDSRRPYVYAISERIFDLDSSVSNETDETSETEDAA
jgi:putative DNA primase/helicase